MPMGTDFTVDGDGTPPVSPSVMLKALPMVEVVMTAKSAYSADVLAMAVTTNSVIDKTLRKNALILRWWGQVVMVGPLESSLPGCGRKAGFDNSLAVKVILASQ